ncbi:unnamed protein product [Pleuronectes platessa]|uniref:Uncharacterized protein n=1 Tax=Pleuronectes platessa TaxID=8262 RepID=A0A9N7THW5_PLEPL|nr:unnamed protein product [Pleuronectes platessa]
MDDTSPPPQTIQKQSQNILKTNGALFCNHDVFRSQSLRSINRGMEAWRRDLTLLVIPSLPLGNTRRSFESKMSEEEVEEMQHKEVAPEVEESPVADEVDDLKPKPKAFAPAMTVPKIPEGEKVDFDDIQKKRQEKDLAELHSLIEAHFIQRKKDEQELITLVNRIVSLPGTLAKIAGVMH